MEVINYLLAIDVDENNIVDTIINNYFNVDQRREFNKHIYKLYVAGVTDADEEIELPNSEFESTTFKDDYLDGYISNHDILIELEQYLSSDENAELEDWLMKEFIDEIDIDD